jgi:hypothetical protein
VITAGAAAIVIEAVCWGIAIAAEIKNAKKR